MNARELKKILKYLYKIEPVSNEIRVRWDVIVAFFGPKYLNKYDNDREIIEPEKFTHIYYESILIIDERITENNINKLFPSSGYIIIFKKLDNNLFSYVGNHLCKEDNYSFLNKSQNISDLVLLKMFTEHMKDQNEKGRNWSLESFVRTNRLELQEKDFRGIFNNESALFNEELDKTFKKMLGPFSYTKNIMVVSGQLSDVSFYYDEYEREYASITIAISNHFMDLIDYDYFDNTKENSEFQNRDNLLDYIYKPYYYSMNFSIPIDKTEAKSIFTNTLAEQYQFMLTIYKNEPDNKTNSLISASLHFAASPYKTKKVFLDWENTISSISKSFTTVKKPPLVQYSSSPSDLITIERILNNKCTDPETLSIYRVGQANMICCETENKYRFAFDFGIPSDKDIENNKLDYEFIRDLKPNAIFISHWHLDHYKGMYLLSRTAWQKLELVVAPARQCTEFAIYYRNLLRYLDFTNKLIMLSSDQFCGKEMGKGLLFTSNRNKSFNNESLLMKINGTLLPGDCCISAWPNELITNATYDKLVVPHHGGRESIDRIRRFNIIKSHIQYYIICVGYNNQYKHPLVIDCITSGTVCCTNINLPNRDENKTRNPIIIYSDGRIDYS